MECAFYNRLSDEKKKGGSEKISAGYTESEIRELFITQIREWFRDETAKGTLKLDALCEAFPERDPQRVEELFGECLWNTISIHDGARI